MLKKIFFGSLYLVLLIMLFTYMVIDPIVDGNHIGTLVDNTKFTGIPVIGVILIFPSFVFTILSLTMEKKAITFCRDLFSMFVGIFTLISSIIGVFNMFNALYIPIIVALCSLAILIISLVNVISAMKQDTNKEEVSE